MCHLCQVETEFEEQWESGKIIGWENKGLENGHISSEESTIDLDYYSTVEELMEVGPEKLKEVPPYLYSIMSCLGSSFSGLLLPCQQLISHLF